MRGIGEEGKGIEKEKEEEEKSGEKRFTGLIREPVWGLVKFEFHHI